VFSKSANPLDLPQKFTICALFKAKSVDPKTYSPPSGKEKKRKEKKRKEMRPSIVGDEVFHRVFNNIFASRFNGLLVVYNADECSMSVRFSYACVTKRDCKIL